MSAVAHFLVPQIQAPTDDEMSETKSQGAPDDEMMTVKALVNTARGEGHLVAYQETEGPVTIAIDAIANAETDQLAPRTSDAHIAVTEVTDAVTTAIETKKDRPEDIAAPAPDHALRENHAAPSAHYNESGDNPLPEKQKPNYKNSGRLAAETNTIQVEGGEGIVLKYHEPPEARKPPAKEPWRLYVFKGDDLLEMVELSERSCWLIGRERAVVDFPLDHPSCSKQHAALQFRYIEKRNEYGDRIGKVKPYLIDLESANGSTVNKEQIPAGRYVEVMDKDVMGFGTSTREYVLMLPK
ncbi:hypothetical protein N7520_003184 [Penicillium odoratum]|uniref:uncharacterized protein n=1 Tax=Penicillium odoratum TaxID=1167516 RepID=UPI00254711E8|nr:uncharacterized protein N7520_003184 [Penicillium odoratum]KAJ5772655.1 hypothetical protein N7520_003184 [Penicillium odoratum]